jgi:hypothetical protein
MSEAKFKEFEDFGRVSKEKFHSDSIRSCLGDEWWILEMYKSDNDADLHTQSIAMHITGSSESCPWAALADYYLPKR